MSRAKRWLHGYLSARLQQAKQAKDGVTRKRWPPPGQGRGFRHRGSMGPFRRSAQCG